MTFLAASFFLVALLYSSVGFGGGSSYLAILSIADLEYTEIPTVALLCNVAVTIAGSFNFLRHDHLSAKQIIPFLLGSIPMAFIFGAISVSQKTFFVTLGVALALAGLILTFAPRNQRDQINRSQFRFQTNCVIGLFIGALAGLTGIGGGVYLSPILHLLSPIKPKSIAALTTVFILLNSTAALIGHSAKSFPFAGVSPEAWALVPCVFVGGVIGSFFGASHRIASKRIIQITGFLTIIAGSRILWRELANQHQSTSSRLIHSERIES